jgi:predicted cobalt transporter CbtA
MGDSLTLNRGTATNAPAVKSQRVNFFYLVTMILLSEAYHRGGVAGRHHEERAPPPSQRVTGARNKYGNATPGSGFRRPLPGHLAESALPGG